MVDIFVFKDYWRSIYFLCSSCMEGSILVYKIIQLCLRGNNYRDDFVNVVVLHSMSAADLQPT
jgi:hypothetical protein